MCQIRSDIKLRPTLSFTSFNGHIYHLQPGAKRSPLSTSMRFNSLGFAVRVKIRKIRKPQPTTNSISPFRSNRSALYTLLPQSPQSLSPQHDFGGEAWKVDETTALLILSLLCVIIDKVCVNTHPIALTTSELRPPKYLLAGTRRTTSATKRIIYRDACNVLYPSHAQTTETTRTPPLQRRPSLPRSSSPPPVSFLTAACCLQARHRRARP